MTVAKSARRPSMADPKKQEEKLLTDLIQRDRI
jgi:hypothetical protein